MEVKKISPQTLGRYRAQYAKLTALKHTPESIRARQEVDAQMEKVPFTDFLSMLTELGVKDSTGKNTLKDAWRTVAVEKAQVMVSFLNKQILDTSDISPFAVATRELAAHLRKGIEQKIPWASGSIPILCQNLSFPDYKTGKYILTNPDNLLTVFNGGWGPGKEGSHHQLGAREIIPTKGMWLTVAPYRVAEDVKGMTPTPPTPPSKKQKKHNR